MGELDRGHGAAPLYQQVLLLVSGWIRSGQLGPGELLPSEPVLARQLATSRATITKAYEMLDRQGLVHRRQGRGTFVAAAPSQHDLGKPTSFTDVTEETGATASQRLVHMERITIGQVRDGIAAEFPLTRDLVVLERVRLSNQIPVGHHRVALDADVFTAAGLNLNAVSHPDFSLYAALDRIGQRPVSALQFFTATGCSPEIAAALGVAPGAPVMRVRRQSSNTSGELIEVVEAHYIGSLYEYQTQMDPEPPRAIERNANDEPAHVHNRRHASRVVAVERLRRNHAVR